MSTQKSTKTTFHTIVSCTQCSRISSLKAVSKLYPSSKHPVWSSPENKYWSAFDNYFNNQKAQLKDHSSTFCIILACTSNSHKKKTL